MCSSNDPDILITGNGVEMSALPGRTRAGRELNMTKERETTGEASLKALIIGAEKMFDNAARLFFEAEALAEVGGIARPLFLH